MNKPFIQTKRRRNQTDKHSNSSKVPSNIAAQRRVDAAPHGVEPDFAPFAAKMKAHGLPDASIRAFGYHYRQLVRGVTGYIYGTEAQPVGELPSAATFEEYAEQGRTALKHTISLKLNGGLGTTMGLEGPKSLIQVKSDLTFLDIIVRQVLHMRQQYNVRLPLVLMNSFSTEAATLEALTAYPELKQSVPLHFTQHQVPRIWKSDLSPVTWPDNPALEWCPPGHGDLYLALQTSGVLRALLDQGYEYAFISNADNLGATVDLNILGYFAAQKLPFLMEVAQREPADRKGGHLARHPHRGLILREVAQCPPEEMDEFQDIERYRYFNTNNLWLHLPTLERLLARSDGLLRLPLIRNQKAVDPTQPESPQVYQLETAMGAAIDLFPNSAAVQVDRTRFLPVKSTSDLLGLWSDAYLLDDHYRIRLHPARKNPRGPQVELDPKHYGLYSQLRAHLTAGVPSLLHCDTLRIEGEIDLTPDMVFTADTVLKATPAEVCP
jgi:UTP--glucose-1-phosphate uridylyltransferase